MTRAPVSEAIYDLKATRASIAELELKKQRQLELYRQTRNKKYELAAYLLECSLADLRGTLERNQRAVERENGARR